VKIGTITYQDNPEMDDELPILKGILNGEVKYHNARRYLEVFASSNVCICVRSSS